MTTKSQVLETLGEVLSFIAPSAGGAVPSDTSTEYADWVRFIQVKQEEASRRGFWRRLLKKSTVTLLPGDTSVLLPVDFQRANSLYIFFADGVDLADPDRAPDHQDIFAEVINTSGDANFGRWRLTFSTAIVASQAAPIWYFAVPPVPTLPADKLLLPGDMVAFGAMAEIFRTTNLEGSQDNAEQAFENRLSTYLAMEVIPERNKILSFISNPRGINRTLEARNRYHNRLDRVGRSF